MYYSRHLEAVVDRIGKRKPVVVLTGARQVGKSTMLKNTLAQVNYIALDSPLVRQSAVDAPSIFFETYQPPIIVDEIQKAVHLFDYVKVYVDANSNKGQLKGQFYLTGSQSLGLMQGVSESLAGRAGVIKMLGLSMRELDGLTYRAPFIPTHEKLKARAKVGRQIKYSELTERIHTGFYPELYETKGDLHDWADFYSSYFQTYIEKDVKDVLKIHDETAFTKFVRAAASLTGRELNLSTLAEACGKDVTTAKRWLTVLRASGLVYLLQPYYNNYLSRLVKTPKLYFLDTGLVCWLLGWNTPTQLVQGAMWGHIFETFVVAEILKSYYNDGIDTPFLYYYRDKEKREIDLVIKDGNVLHPIEIKTTSDPNISATKTFCLLEKIPNMKRGSGTVICTANENLPLPMSQTDVILPAHLI